MGPFFLVNCYLEIEFQKKFRLDPPPPLAYVAVYYRSPEQPTERKLIQYPANNLGPYKISKYKYGPQA